MPHLDAVRAVAVLAVVLRHFAPAATPAAERLVYLGSLGVPLFFCLSGFLVTGILLDARARAEQAGAPLGGVWLRFFARRALRIFPLYYAVLLAAWCVDVPGVRATVGWHATYLSNVLVALTGVWLGPSSPLWSLAVEEQFYLFWPGVVLFSGRRALPWVLAAFAFAGPLFRLLTPTIGFVDPDLAGVVLLPGAFDTLALGGLAAWGVREAPAATARLAVPALGVGGAAMVAWAVAHVAGMFDGTPFWARSVQAVAFTGLVLVAARGFRGGLARVAELRPVVHLGKVSYGVYVLHLLLVPALIGIGYDERGAWWRLAVVFPLTWALAALSMRWFEGPLNELKRYVPYLARPPRA